MSRIVYVLSARLGDVPISEEPWRRRQTTIGTVVSYELVLLFKHVCINCNCNHVHQSLVAVSSSYLCAPKYVQ